MVEASGPRLRRIEIELNLGAHRVVAEDLPDLRAHLLTHGVLDAVRLQFRDRPLEVRARERDRVDDTSALRRQLVRGDVQDGTTARVEPQAVEAHGRALALGEAEDGAVEAARGIDIVGENVEVVHTLDRHDSSMPCGTHYRSVVQG